MNSIIKTLVVSIALSFTVGLFVPLMLGTPAAQAKEVSVKPDQQKTIDHLTKHQSYPATRAELLASCKNLIDFSDAEKKWFAAHLPEGSYASADEVVKALFKK